jgi:hypothetical protein
MSHRDTMRMIAEVAKSIRVGLAALPHDEARRAFLGKAYEELVGYNPFVDDPLQTVEGVTDLYCGVVKVSFEEVLEDEE